MTNEIQLSDTNMLSYLLMLLHDLPHDYKANRLGELWKGVVNRGSGGGGEKGEKRKWEEPNPLEQESNPLGPLERVMGLSVVGEPLSELDIDDITEEDAVLFKKIIGIATETAKEEFPSLAINIKAKAKTLVRRLDGKTPNTRFAANEMQNLIKLMYKIKIQILDALHPPSPPLHTPPPPLPQTSSSLPRTSSSFHTPSDLSSISSGGYWGKKNIPGLQSVSSSSSSTDSTTPDSSIGKYHTAQTNTKDGNIRAKQKSNNDAMNEMFRNAFEIIFSGTENGEIKEIITAFYTFYSMIKITSEISPLDVFDSSYVNSSLLIYLILKRSSINADLKLIFKTVVEKTGVEGDRGVRGGTVQFSTEQNEYIKTIKDKYNEYYNRPKDTLEPPKDTREDLDLNGIKKDTLDLINILKTREPPWEQIWDNYKIKYKTIDRQLKTIEIQENILKNSLKNSSKSSRGETSRRDEYNNNLGYTIKIQYLKIIFENIISQIQKKQKESSMEVDYDETTPLRTIATQNPHKLVSALMKGVFEFSGIERIDSPKNADDEFLNAEFDRLEGVANGSGTYTTGETLDTNLLTDFIAYADNKKATTPIAKGDNWIKTNAHPMYGSQKNDKPHIINNGVILSTLNSSTIISSNVTCTLSQRVDAMGNFGDCSKTTNVGAAEQKDKTTKLSYTTDVIITDESETDYYTSRMEEIKNKNNGKKEIIISYSLKLGNLVTPLFFKTIDNSDPRILDLSLTNTYKSVITRLLYIWAEDNSTSSTLDNKIILNNLYDIIINDKETFIDLLLTALQKGSGDGNQELNAFFANRGYILPNNVKFNNPLLYVANDRPSAVRAMFVVINGEGDINENVTAGFPPQLVYVSRPGYAQVGQFSEGIKVPKNTTRKKPNTGKPNTGKTQHRKKPNSKITKKVKSNSKNTKKVKTPKK